jgi:hypothetical protein
VEAVAGLDRLGGDGAFGEGGEGRFELGDGVAGGELAEAAAIGAGGAGGFLGGKAVEGGGVGAEDGEEGFGLRAGGGVGGGDEDVGGLVEGGRAEAGGIGVIGGAEVGVGGVGGFDGDVEELADEGLFVVSTWSGASSRGAGSRPRRRASWRRRVRIASARAAARQARPGLPLGAWWCWASAAMAEAAMVSPLTVISGRRGLWCMVMADLSGSGGART